jgi:hypothetical protein
VLQIVLPRLVGSRQAADAFVDQLPGVKEEAVAVICRDLLSGTASFADQLVKRLLVDGGADQLLLVGADAEFSQLVRDAAAARDVTGQLKELPAGSELLV